MSIVKLLHKIDIHTLDGIAADSLHFNEIGEVEIETHKAIFCDPYAINKATGSFIVVHPITNDTLAGGIISEPYALESAGAGGGLLPSAGASQGLIVWITGLSGSGKTTICRALH